jgi:nitrogen fixation/metabolism regulation signal transduction histidine kinase
VVNKIIKQFLDFARPPPSPEPMDVRAILEGPPGLAGLRNGSPENFPSAAAPDLPPVPMDREQMKQVFLNFYAECHPGHGWGKFSG